MVIPRKLATLIAAFAALVMVVAMQPVAQAVPDPGSQRYLVTGLKTPQQRSALARTGASIDRVRPDGTVEISAIPSEATAIKRLGLKMRALPAEKPVPGLAATSYHTYAETLAEIDQTVANYPQIAKKVVF